MHGSHNLVFNHAYLRSHTKMISKSASLLITLFRVPNVQNVGVSLHIYTDIQYCYGK